MKETTGCLKERNGKTNRKQQTEKTRQIFAGKSRTVPSVRNIYNLTNHTVTKWKQKEFTPSETDMPKEKLT